MKDTQNSTQELEKLFAAMKAMSGEINVNLVFDEFLKRAKREKEITVKMINEETKVSASSISGFRNGKQGLIVESLQKVINWVNSQ